MTGLKQPQAIGQQTGLAPHAPRLRRLIRQRIQRADFLDPALLGEPAWDMLLDLALAEATGRAISVTSACLASHGPPTTALRHLTLLIERGLVDRHPHPEDRRSIRVRLTAHGRETMARYLEAAA